MQQGPPRRRRARAVSDAPVEALLARQEDLAKGWLLTMLEQSPLQHAPDILGGDFALDGPPLCTALVRGLAADAELRRLEPGGDLESLASRAAEIAGVRGVEASLGAVDALSAVVWSAVRAELVDPDIDQVSELAERLALVSELLRGAVLRRVARGGQADEPGPVEEAPELPVEAPPEPPEPLEHPAAIQRGRLRPVAFEGPPAASDPGPEMGHEHPQPSGPLWKGALADELARAARSGAPLSLLLIELEDATRMRAAESAGEAGAAFSRFLQAVRTVVRRQDLLARESEAKVWVIARDTGRRGAQKLAERAVEAVRAAAPWRGAPLSISVGLAVYGEDAGDLEDLIAAAEEACFAAAASGLGPSSAAVSAPEAGAGAPDAP